MKPPGLALGGVIPALVTPFRGADNALDKAALAHLAIRVIARGASGVVVCGSTGEAPALSAEEHARAVRVVAEAVGTRGTVIAGIGAPCTEVALQLAVAAQRAGATALLVSAPPYVKPGQSGLIKHVRAARRVTDLPLVLYDVPGRAAVAFSDDTVARLFEAGAIVALKDASGDLARPPRLRALCGAGLRQLSGDDATALAHLAMGGVGCVSVSANVAPALCATLQRAWATGLFDRAAALRDLLAPLDATLFCETNPIPVKAALGLLQLCEPTPRLPLTVAEDASHARIAAVLEALMPLEAELAREPDRVPHRLAVA